MPILGVAQGGDTVITLFNFYAKEIFLIKKTNNRQL